MNINTTRSTPTTSAVALTAAAARRSVLQCAHLAMPGCPSCGGQGWHMQRVEFGIAGVEAVACHCTEGR